MIHSRTAVRFVYKCDLALALATLNFSDPQSDLRKLTTQCNALVTESKRIETLWKLMNNSLWIGEVGRKYQLDIKKVPEGDPRALAGTCIYSGHAFDPQYRALDRKTDPMVVPATYDHIFWTGNAATAVWNEADYLAKAMGLPQVTNHLTSYLDVYKYIEAANLTQEPTNITVGLMLEAIWTLYTSEKELN